MMMMKSILDVDALAAIVVAEQRGRVPFEQMTPQEAREAYRSGCVLTGPPPRDMSRVEDGEWAGPSGALRYRLYQPSAEPDLPALLYLHGGGWVVGDLDSHDGVCRRLAADSGCAVLALDYRLAPEHPFPAAFDDALAAWLAFSTQAAALGLDASRLGLAGDSAGAALAAAVALACRDAAADTGTAAAALVQPRCQLLFYPATDLTAVLPSYAEHDQPDTRVFLKASTMRWFRAHYAPDPVSWTDWRGSPLHADNSANLPPTLLLTVGHDPLRDEGLAYAEALTQAGNWVSHLHLPNQMHGLLTQSRLMPASEMVWALAAAFTRQQLQAIN
jgi:acetyl esterase